MFRKAILKIEKLHKKWDLNQKLLLFAETREIWHKVGQAEDGLKLRRCWELFITKAV